MLHLSQEQKMAIEIHGEGGFPDEICGFIVGTIKDSDKTVVEVWPIENAWDTAGDALEGASARFLGEAKGRRFLIPPDEWMRSDRRARERGLDILGCYHTHPNHPAKPSVYDLEMARGTFPGYSYIILSVYAGSAAEMTSWVLRDDYSEFEPEAIRGA